jgi:hypothetical protein
VNQVLQRVLMNKNQARDSRTYNHFRDGGKDKEKGHVGLVDEDVTSDEESEVCIVEWIDAPKEKPITCTFLKPGLGKMEEMKFTFDITKCIKLFDVLLQNNVIRLKGGHTIPSVEWITRRKYCKWHVSFSHTTNECSYFR